MKLRGALLLVVAATVCALSGLISPQEAAASVDAVNQWPAKPTIVSNSNTAGVSGSFTVAPGTKRLMLVAVAIESTTAPTVAVSYGGQALTQIVLNTTGANKIWVGRLNEAGIVAAGANKTLSATLTGAGTITATYVTAAVYAGVDQTTPVIGSSSLGIGTAALTIGPVGYTPSVSAINGNNGLSVYLVNWNNTNVGQTTPATGFTEVRDYIGTNFSLSANYKVKTGASAESITSTTTTSAIAALAAVTLNPAAGAGALSVATVTTCGDCHGYPPQDGPYTTRNVPPGQFIGAHSKHSGTDEGQYGYVCTECHYNNGSILKHENAFKDISGSRVPRNTYGAATNIAMTNSPTFTQTCTKSTCHSSGRTTRQYATSPVWNSTTTCLSCHGGRSTTNPYPPARSANNFSMSTSHSQHLKYLSTEMNCQTCHGKIAANHTTLKDYTGAIYHGNGSKNVNFTQIAYGSYTSFKSTASGSSANTKVCTNTSCHGGSTRGDWKESTAINSNHTCTHCHGVATGVSAGMSVTGANRYNLRFFAPGWNKTGTSTDQTASSNNIRVGSHFKHLSSAYMKNIKCNECHKVPSTPFSADTNHTLNTLRFNSGTLDFAQSSSARILIGVTSGSTPAQLASFAGYTNGTAVKAATCSSVYCHGSRLKNGAAGGTYLKPYWNYSAMINYSNPDQACARCHGNPPSSVTASHNGVTPTTGCGGCHGSVVDGTGKIINKALHINGQVEGGGHAYPYSGSVHDSLAVPTTNCTGCHALGTGASPYPVTRPTKPDCRACHKLANPGTGCATCHGDATGRPNGGGAVLTAFPNYSGSHTKHVVGQSMACTDCHYTYGTGTTTHGSSNGTAKVNVTFVGLSSSSGLFHATKTTTQATCNNVACHGTAIWGVTKLDCVSCHAAAVSIKTGPLTGGTRRAVSTELQTSGTRNHKSTATGTAPTKWDCIVCHMEGDMSSGSSVPVVHGNGVLDLRDPDTGLQIKKVRWTGLTFAQNLNDPGGRYVSTLTNLTTSRFRRDLSLVLESDPKWLQVASIQMNLCLKCHDYNGAASNSAWTKNAGGTVIGTAYQPFGNAAASTATLYFIAPGASTANKSAAGNTTGAVMNVFSQLSSGNASYHPVRGRQNNNYVSGTTGLKAPWGNTTKSSTGSNFGATTIYGYLVSCFDCHAGNGASGAQNSTVVAHGNGTTGTAMALRAKTTAGGTATAASPNICTICHADKYTLTSQHGTGSALQVGSSSMSATTFGTCNNCHDTKTNNVGARAVAAHGFEGQEATGTNFAGGRTYGFWRGGGGNATNFMPGTCTVSCTTRTYTPGGMY